MLLTATSSATTKRMINYQFTYYNPSTPTDLGGMAALEPQVLIDLNERELSRSGVLSAAFF